jgi:hypothetical protein
LGCWRRIEASRSLVNVSDPSSAESSEHKTPSVICWASERLRYFDSGINTKLTFLPREFFEHEAACRRTERELSTGSAFNYHIPPFSTFDNVEDHVLESINNLGLGLPSIDGCGGLRLA